MKRIAPFQLTNFVKSFTLFFFGFTFLWALTNYIIIRDVIVSWFVFTINFVLSLGIGWWYYRQRFRLVFQYDQNGFELNVGKNCTTYHWRDFTTVSLYHRGQGEFNIRLYKPDGTIYEIPASSLRLDPSAFRFEAMDMVKAVSREQA